MGSLSNGGWRVQFRGRSRLLSCASVAQFLLPVDMQVIRDDMQAGRSDKDVCERVTSEYGETILFSLAFDAQTAILWLDPVS